MIHEQDLEKLQYPIGRFTWDGEWNPQRREELTLGIELLPSLLRQAVAGLNEEQLDTSYRPEGWTVRQVVHHLADSHLNSVTRFKLALTEKNPVIKPYMEARWAELADSAAGPVEPSLLLLEGLHARWVRLLRSMSEDQFQMMFYHPDNGELVSLAQATATYHWHGLHHVSHIQTLRAMSGWD